jgi:hypothetical protein
MSGLLSARQHADSGTFYLLFNNLRGTIAAGERVAATLEFGKTRNLPLT